MEEEPYTHVISHFSLSKCRFNRSALDPEFFDGVDHVVENMFDEIDIQCNNFQKFRTYRTLTYITFSMVAIAFLILIVMTSIGATLENFLILGIGFALCFIFIIISIVLAIWNTSRLKGLVEKYGIIIERIVNRYNTECLLNYGFKARYYGSMDEYREVYRRLGRKRKISHFELQMWIEFSKNYVLPNSLKMTPTLTPSRSTVLNQVSPSRLLSPVAGNIIVLPNPPVMISPVRVQQIPLQSVISPGGYATIPPYISNF